jgi:hypothetical protein
VHSGVVRNFLADACQAVVEDPNSAVGSTERSVGLSQRRIEVRSEMRWRSAFAGDRSLETLDGFEVIPALCRRESECHASANRGSHVTCGEGLREDLVELALGGGEIV